MELKDVVLKLVGPVNPRIGEGFSIKNIPYRVKDVRWDFKDKLVAVILC